MTSSLYCPTCGAANQPQTAFCFACGLALSTGPGSQTGLLPNAHLLQQRYRILAQVGKGGFGAVYQAEDILLGNRLVAIKEMSQYGLTPQELTQAIDAFQREAVLLAGLKHPNLPLIYDQFHDAGRHYLVMEFITGQTLEEYLAARGGKLPVAETLQIGLQLCNVLGYLHTRQPPIIFRDLKPANVMLTAEGQLYLIDFGIARHFKPGQTRDTIAFGSPGYAAPEQYGKAQTNPRSDIYSLGAILHQLLSGSDPSETPFRFAPLDSSLPGGLAALITQMVELDESKRPADADTVRQMLQHIINTPGSSQPGMRSLIFQPPSMPQPAQAASASSTQVRMPSSAAPLPAAPTPPVVTAHLTYDQHMDWIWSVAWSPDGTYIASASQDKTIQVWDANALTPIASYRGHTGAVLSVAWSPDGRSIASASADGTVQVWDAFTGKPRFTYRGHTHSVTSIAWLPRGAGIASGSLDQTVHVWDPNTGLSLLPHRQQTIDARSQIAAIACSPTKLDMAVGGRDMDWVAIYSHGSLITYYSHQTAPVDALAYSPDGLRVASASGDGSVVVYSDNYRFFRYSGHTGIVQAVAWSPDGKYLASGGQDETVQVWAPTYPGRPLCVYREHNSEVRSVAWSPDGKRIASGGLDKTIHIWQPVW